MHSFNFFSDRAIFLTVLNHVDECWLLHLCHMLTNYWFLEYGEILLCFLALSNYRGFASFHEKRPHHRPHWKACSFPKWAVFYHSSGSFCTSGSFSLGCLLFLSTWKNNLFSVSRFRHLSSWKTLHIPFFALALCHLDSYHLAQVTLHICFPVGLHPWTMSSLHRSIHNTYTTVPGTIFKSHIHWMNEWMNE